MDRNLSEQRQLILISRDVCQHARATVASARSAIARAHVLLRRVKRERRDRLASIPVDAATLAD